MKCQCEAAGECPVLGRTMTPRQWAICQGTAPGVTPEQCEFYRSTWLSASLPRPGTLLRLLLADLGLEDFSGCGCDEKVAKMDQWGVAGCRQRRGTIIEWLRGAASRTHWGAKLAAAVHAAALIPPQHWRDPIPWLVDESIARANAQELALVQPLIEELRGPARPRLAHWDLQPDVIAAHRHLFDEAAAAAPAARPPVEFSGRGIVTLGGNSKYFGAAWVLVSVLRKLGCTLPVEWWFLGPHELDPKMIALAEQLGGVQVVDLQERLAEFGRGPRVLGGWESKIWAIMFSRFREVLFLDADQVPVRDPAFLFDEPAYREAGAVFWPDFPPIGWQIDETGFEVAGLPTPGRTVRPGWKNPTDYRPFETGQILVDKARHWPALELTRHVNDHADFWFPAAARGNHAWHCYGDKDTFFLAWSRLGAAYAMPPDCSFAGSSAAGAFLQRDFAGGVLFQHRVQPATKWVLHGNNPEVPGFKHHRECLQALAELRERWPGHPYDAGDEGPAEQAIAATVRGRKIWFRPGGDPLTLDFAAGGVTGDPKLHWTISTLAGRRPDGVLVLAAFDKALALLGRDNLGNWVNHGTRDFLVDAPPAGFELPLEPDEIGIWNDIARDNEYRLPEQFDPADVILDVGGHCGIFAYACLARGAGRVVSIEPNPDNYRRLVHNVAKFGNRAAAFPAAAWRCDEPPGALQIEQKPGAEHSGGWSAIGTSGGITVASVPFSALVELLGQVRLCKLDCEGAEWPILETFRDWDRVAAWCGEYHHATIDQADRRLRAILEPAGYRVQVEQHPRAPELGHFWATRETSRPPLVLFLCSGNYYRSRYAEAVFNKAAAARGLSWRAFSRALNPDAKPGPIAPEAAAALRATGTPFVERRGSHALARDFEKARLIIAVNEREHRPMMRARFAEWEPRTVFWQVDDMDRARPETALPLIEQQIAALLDQIEAGK